VVLVLVGIAVRRCWAEPATPDCSPSTKRWVSVRLVGEGWSPGSTETVLTDLRAEWRRHGIEACPSGTQGLPAPIVILEIEAIRPEVLHLSLDLTDPTSGKRPARELDLSSMPLDGHSLAVAVAADELLTSSWIKLASRSTADAPQPPAPSVDAQAAVEPAQSAAPAGAPRRHEVALLASTEQFARGPWAYGLDLAVRRWLLPRWGVELGGGARMVQEQSATHGRVRSRALPLSLRILAGLVPYASRARAGAAAALSATTLFFEAEPEPGASASSGSAVAIYLRGELWTDVALGRFRVRVAAGVGAPLRSVTADDSGSPVAGARGLELHGQAGLVLEL